MRLVPVFDIRSSLAGADEQSFLEEALDGILSRACQGCRL